MPTGVVTTTLQAAFLSSLSNLLAQLISAYQNQKPFHLDLVPLLQFVLWTLISTPPNIYWQAFLEESYPSTATDVGGRPRLSKTNTIKKFSLDQTIGASINTAAFIAGLNAIKGRTVTEITSKVEQDFWPLMTSGWKLWPLVSLLNFTVVPAHRRILFGSMVGLVWGIYVSMVAARQ